MISNYAQTYVLLIFTVTFYINKFITYFSSLNVTMFYQKAEGRWTGSKKWRLERGFFFYCFTLQIEHNYWNNTIVPTSEPYVFTYFAPWIRWFSYKKYWGEEWKAAVNHLPLSTIRQLRLKKIYLIKAWDFAGVSPICPKIAHFFALVLFTPLIITVE